MKFIQLTFLYRPLANIKKRQYTILFMIFCLFSANTYPGIVAEWRFDDLVWSSSVSEVRDSSGNGYHGIAYNSDPIAGQMCNAADFNIPGITDYIKLDHNSLDGLNDWTLSVWVTSNINSAQTILSAARNDPELNEAVMYFSNASTFWPSIRSNPFFDNAAQITMPYRIDDGNFHHLVWTRDQSQSETCLYLDRNFVGCYVHSDGGNQMDVIVDGLIIGQEQDSVGGGFDVNQAWSGLIDEMILFDTELSTAEIQAGYDNQVIGNNWDGSPRVCPEALPPITAYWRFDESIWTGAPGEVQDLSGNALHMTAMGGATTENLAQAILGDPGTCSYGLFDGVSQYTEIADHPLLDISNNLSITLWFKADALPGGGLSTLLSKDENYEMHVTPAGEINWWWSSSNLTTAGANITPGQWHHLAVTFRSGEQVIYIDSVERGRSAWVGSLPLNNDPLQIGQDQGFAGRYFPGRIDEVRIFASTLTHGQVVQSNIDVHLCTSNSSCPYTYRDNFNTQNYGINDGTKDFAASWVETGDNNNAASGNVLIWTDGQLYIRNNSGTLPTIYRELDLSLATTAELSINLSTSNTLENNDRIAIEVSDNGGASYTTLETIRNDRAELWVRDISAFASANTRIRFRITQGYTNGDEWMRFQDVTINTDEPCGLDHFEIFHDGAGINCLREAVSIRAYDALGNIVTGYTGLVNISTTTTNGNWFTLDSFGASLDLAQGTLTDTAGDDNGAATYQFVTGDGGTVTLYLENTHDESTNVNVADGTETDNNLEGDIIFRPFGYIASGASGSIIPVPTQVAAKPFNVWLTAAGQTPTQPNCGVIEEYTGVKAVNFWSNYSAPATSITPIQIDGSSIAATEPTSVPQNVTFTNGVAMLSVQYDDVGSIGFSAKDEVGIGDPATGTTDEVIGGVTPFVVRPFAYEILVAGNPNATGGGDSVYATAGNNFSTTMRSLLWQAADDLDTNGYPDSGSNVSDNGITPNIVNVSGNITLSPAAQVVINSNGALGDALVDFSDFALIGSGNEGTAPVTQSWSEVGILTINANTANFMSGGQAVTGQRTNIGRIIPDNFNVTIVNDFDAQCSGTSSYGGFANGFAGLNKNGQIDAVSFNVQARNSSNVATINYDNDFAKLEAGTLTLSGYDVGAGAPTTGTLNSSTAAYLFDNTGSSTIPFSNVHYQFDNLAAPIQLRVDLNATDSDAVTGSASSSAVATRLGRLRLKNAYGPETTMLEMPLLTEYYSGTTWETNTLDSCTSYVNTGIQFLGGTYQGDLNPGETSALLPNPPITIVSGQSPLSQGFWYTAPGVGNSGTVDVYFDLSSFDWLTFDWNNDLLKDNPIATVGFGHYRSSDRIIYWQEN